MSRRALDIVLHFEAPAGPDPIFPEWYVRRMKRNDRIAEIIVASIAALVVISIFV